MNKKVHIISHSKNSEHNPFPFLFKNPYQRETSISCLLYASQLGLKLTTFALTRNQT